MLIKKEEYVRLYEEKEQFRKKAELLHDENMDLKAEYEDKIKKSSQRVNTLQGDKRSLQSDLDDLESRLYAANYTKGQLQEKMDEMGKVLNDIQKIVLLPLAELKKQSEQLGLSVTYDHVAKYWCFDGGIADSEDDAYLRAILVHILKEQ
ncbi:MULTISPECIES: hypothetical protein [Clostridia]|uniref:hypothetical protein n=1 Tax=Clostridia TaxID=186801 RepID=UPI000E494E5D|nr:MULTISPECIES: hypothetical protein [Clostridia]RHV71060.1 hypothetical protein DXB15_03880 [Roseburia sp. OM02-15]